MCYGDWDMLGSVGSHLCLPMEVELYEATDRVDSIEHDVDVRCIIRSERAAVAMVDVDQQTLHAALSQCSNPEACKGSLHSNGR